MAKKSTASSEGKKNGGEFKRGALLCVLIIIILFFFFRKGQLFLLLFLPQLCFMRTETSLWFSQGRMKRAFRRTVEVFLARSSFVISPPPLLNSGKRLFEQGWLTGILESQREVGQGEIRKPAALPRKKYQWPWTVLIFPNQIWRGEKNRRREASSPTPPSRAEEASGNIKPTKTTNFLVYL